ncbi:MAG: carbohydrate ABC transporter permease [Clostridiales bacterium]|nr:carbohydrate ABC transporter permease [Clostridiales bacterium]
MRTKKIVQRTLLYITLIGVAFVMLYPFAWMVSASLKYDKDIFIYPMKWLPKSIDSVLYNYKTIFTKISYGLFYLNTTKLTLIITFIQVLTSSLAAYSFSRMQYKWRDKIFLLYLATLMVPWHAIMIPQFVIIKSMGLYDNHLSLILLQSFSAFGVFLLRQYMLSIPKELDEAARIDGCGHLRIYWQIIMPLSKPGIATLIILTFNSVWNDYMAPMLYLESKSNLTVQLGLSYFKTQYSMQYGLTMAATVCSIIPIIIVYIFAQKYIIDGIAHSGLKG